MSPKALPSDLHQSTSVASCMSSDLGLCLYETTMSRRRNYPVLRRLASADSRVSAFNYRSASRPTRQYIVTLSHVDTLPPDRAVVRRKIFGWASEKCRRSRRERMPEQRNAAWARLQREIDETLSIVVPSCFHSPRQRFSEYVTQRM